MESRFERCATCQRLKKFGVRCMVCAQIVLATLPTIHTHDHERDRRQPPARVLTVAASTASVSQPSSGVIINWPSKST